MKTPAEGTQIPINTATKPQLRAFANHLGCPTTNFDSEAKLREKIAATGYDAAHIIAFDASDVKATAARAVAAGDAVPEPMVTLTLNQSSEAGGKRGLFVGVNGKAMMIPRNVRCDVKLRYWNALNDAWETKYQFDDEAKANTPVEMHSYPFQVHKMPSDEEIARWRAWEAAEEARLLKVA